MSLEDFAVDTTFTKAVWERLQPELATAKSMSSQTNINFELLY